MTSGGNNCNHFAENQVTKFSARDAGDFSDAAGEREMAPKCGSLPRDSGDLAGLFLQVSASQMCLCCADEEVCGDVSQELSGTDDDNDGDPSNDEQISCSPPVSSPRNNE